MSSKEDIIQFWLDAAGKYPVLHPEQVLVLARQVQSNPPGSKKRDGAVRKLVRHNLKLIPRIARRVMKSKYGKPYGGDFTVDVFQSGVIGLTRAAELYDPTKGYAFSTYANAWIFQSMQRDVYNNVSSIRVPENTLREFYSVFRSAKTPEELKDIDPKKLDRYHATFYAINCKSLEMTAKDDKELTLLDFVVDHRSEKEMEVASSVDDLVSLSRTCDLSKKLALDYFKHEKPVMAIALEHQIPRSRVSDLIDSCLASIKENMTLIK